MTRFAPSILTAALSAANGHKGMFFRLSQTIALWQQRQKLATLDDAALRDIGLTRTEALTESERPLWDVPSRWLR